MRMRLLDTRHETSDKLELGLELELEMNAKSWSPNGMEESRFLLCVGGHFEFNPTGFVPVSLHSSDTFGLLKSRT